MKNCNLYRKAFAFLCVFVLISSCAKEEVVSQKQEQSEKQQGAPQGERATLSLEGGLWEDGPKAFVLDPDKAGVPQFRFEAKEYDIKLYLKKKGEAPITTLDAKAIYSVLKTGEKHFSISVDDFSLQGAGQKFVKGEQGWYVCGVIGEAPANPSDQQVSWSADQKHKLPLGFPWTELSLSDNGMGEQRSLRFNLIGNLLKVGLRNNIISPVEVSTVKLRSTTVAFSGSFAPENVQDSHLTSGSYMAFKSTSSDKDFSFAVRQQNNSGLRVASGKEQMLNNVFIWTYPLDKNGSIEAKMEVVTRPKGMTAQELASSSLPAKEKKTFTSWSVASVLKAPKQGYEHSKVHKAPFMVTSDLMITEEYHFNKSHLNLSIIELHNPTLEPIELRHYGLMRAGEDLVHSVNGVAFFPQNDQTAEERYVMTNQAGGYKEARTYQALVMPLDLVTGDAADVDWAYWRWRTYSPGQRDGGDPNKTRYYRHSLKVKTIKSGAASGDNVRDVAFQAPPQNPVLAPGKTMLILGPGYIEYTPDKKGYGILYPTAAGPVASGGAAQRGQLGPGLQPLESYRLGYCQYVFAMANYSAPNTNSRNDASSTNHLDTDHGIVLVKQRSNGTNFPDRKIIDASIPYNNAGSPLSDIRTLRTTSTDTYSRVRCDGDYFPSTVFRIENWHGEDMNWSNMTRTAWKTREYTTNRMTLGTRWFVQDGSKANQNNWGAAFQPPTKSW